jgi:hippurate hydrolase
MGLTVRSRKPEVRKHLLDAISRVVEAEAQAGGAEKKPLIEKLESAASVYNDPALARHLAPVLETALGKSNVSAGEPIMTSEDYSVFVQAGVPSLYFELGAADAKKLAAANAAGAPMPSLHSAVFAPVVEPALRTGIAAEVALLRNLLQGTSAGVRNFTERK